MSTTHLELLNEPSSLLRHQYLKIQRHGDIPQNRKTQFGLMSTICDGILCDGILCDYKAK